MTETTAKSGGSGSSTTPVDEDPPDTGTAATGRATVGRATVPTDTPSPKFTRAPGMPPPPEEPPDGRASADGDRSGGRPSATVPIVAKAKKAVAAAAEVAANAVKKDPGTTGTVPGKPRITLGRPGTEAGPGAGGVAAAGAAAVGAARVTEAVRAARTAVSSAASRGPRRARLNLKRIDPWSVMKFSFAVSIVLFIVVIVATAVLYLALDAMGVWQSLNGTLGDLLNASGNQGTAAFRVTAWGVIGTAMLVGAVNVVLFTALATLGAFIYNVCADLVGGIELTLAERD
jgi:Transmembrane domain of unknown function (DUF3566)